MRLSQWDFYLGLHGCITATKLVVLTLSHLSHFDLALKLPLPIFNLLLKFEQLRRQNWLISLLKDGNLLLESLALLFRRFVFLKLRLNIIMKGRHVGGLLDLLVDGQLGCGFSQLALFHSHFLRFHFIETFAFIYLISLSLHLIPYRIMLHLKNFVIGFHFIESLL